MSFADASAALPRGPCSLIRSRADFTAAGKKMPHPAHLLVSLPSDSSPALILKHSLKIPLMPTHHDHANLIWQIADLLRGPYRPPQYERVMLPMTVPRRFDCSPRPRLRARHSFFTSSSSTTHGLSSPNARRGFLAIMRKSQCR